MSSREEQQAQARGAREAKERSEARADRRRGQLRALGSVLGVAAIVVVVLVLVSQGSSRTSNASSGSAVVGTADMRAMLAGIPQSATTLGDPKAPVVLTEFADLQCPFCAQYATDVLPQIIQRYVRTGKLRLDLRLLTFIGPDSEVAARAAEAAATRDRLWNFIDLFYRNQGQENSGYVTDTFLSKIATAAGVPAARVVRSATTGAALQQPLQTADAQAQAAGVNSTPAFLIGSKAGEGKTLNVTALDIGAFAAAIDPELKP